MKYVGSKTKIAKEISGLINAIINQNDVKKYLEPFVGGANVIDKIVCEKRYGLDVDAMLIDLLKNYSQKILSFPDILTKEHYYDVRDNPEKYDSTYRAAILFFGSYNSRVYGGCYGAISNTKNGTSRNYFQEAKRNFDKQLPYLKNIIFSKRNFFDIDCEKIHGYVIYCDPPYGDGIGYSIPFNTKVFWEKVRQLSKDNIVLISEYNAPSDFMCVFEQKVKTHMNNRNKLQKVEKLFMFSSEQNKAIIQSIDWEVKQ